MRLVKSGFSLIAVAFMMAACTASVSAQATVILQNVKFPFTAEVFVSCGNNGAGEIVATSKYQLVHVPEHPAADRPRASGQFFAASTFHVTMNANGKVSAFVDHVSAECP